MTKISNGGEFRFLKRYFKNEARSLKANTLGVGDDAAVIEGPKDLLYVLTTDTLIENRHFKLQYFSPEDLAHKSLATNLSDIAAMGARPEFALLNLHLKPELELRWCDRFFSTIKRHARKYGVLILGGNTTAGPADPLFLSLTLIGVARRQQLKLRAHAKTGDRLYVSRHLGEASAGLEILRKGLSPKKQTSLKALTRAQLRPRAEIEAGEWLGKQKGVGAMIDLSDGLSSDLVHILEASQKSARVDIEKLPLSRALLGYCSKEKALSHALSGGEDYALLFSVRPDFAKALESRFKRRFGRSLFEIGEVKSSRFGKPGQIRYFEKGKSCEVLPKKGFDHLGP